MSYFDISDISKDLQTKTVKFLRDNKTKSANITEQVGLDFIDLVKKSNHELMSGVSTLIFDNPDAYNQATAKRAEIESIYQAMNGEDFPGKSDLDKKLNEATSIINACANYSADLPITVQKANLLIFLSQNNDAKFSVVNPESLVDWYLENIAMEDKDSIPAAVNIFKDAEIVDLNKFELSEEEMIQMAIELSIQDEEIRKQEAIDAEFASNLEAEQIEEFQNYVSYFDKYHQEADDFAYAQALELEAY